jgi:hypothetical protein
MCSIPMITLPDCNEPFVIETDACDKGVRVVLQQKGHRIAFFSKASSISNHRLSTYEKEFLAMLMVVDKWRPYLMKLSFVIKTDHKSLPFAGSKYVDGNADEGND